MIHCRAFPPWLGLLFVLPLQTCSEPPPRSAKLDVAPVDARTLEVEYAKVAGEWVPTNRIQYRYDERGDLTERVTTTFGDSSWINRFRLTWVYDGNRRLQRTWRGVWRDDRWVRVAQSEFFYGSGGELHARTDSALELVPSQPSLVRQVYRFDDDNRVVEELGLVRVDDAWVSHQRLVYRYDATGKETVKIWQDFRGNAWVNNRRMFLSYDADGNHVQTLRQNWDGDDWADNLRYLLTVNDEGIRTEALWQMPSADGWQDFRLVAYHY